MTGSVNVGKQVKALREAHGWSLGDLSEKAQISKSYLAKLEQSEEPNPSMDVMLKLAGAFKTTIAILMGRGGFEGAAFDSIPEPDKALREFLAERHKAGHPIPVDDVQVLLSIQRRSKNPITKEKWAALLEVVRGLAGEGQ